MEFLKKIKEKSPEYDSNLEDLISRFTVSQGGRAGAAKGSATYEGGRFFYTKYEIYMYAIMLGLRNDYRLPLEGIKKKSKFMEIGSWKPEDLTDFIIMSVLGKMDLDFLEMEKKEDKDVEKEVLKIKKTLEEYAFGGFDRIKSKLKSDPSFFENNDNCFIDLIEEK